jgi:hypothetical protein
MTIYHDDPSKFVEDQTLAGQAMIRADALEREGAQARIEAARAVAVDAGPILPRSAFESSPF